MHAILQNPYILQRLDIVQSISLVVLLIEMNGFEAILKQVTDLYVVTDVKADGYLVKAGIKITERNTEYPDRYLLLKRLKDDNYLVADFGDFAPHQLQNLLKVCRVNKTYLEDYADSISRMVRQVNQWVQSTGSEFLIDPEMFRMGSRGSGSNDTQPHRAPDRQEKASAFR
jgi:hypothetical protein